jgi:hypothetical protein
MAERTEHGQERHQEDVRPTAEPMFLHLMEGITPAFARPDAIVNNVSNWDAGFESNYRSSDGQKTLRESS